MLRRSLLALSIFAGLPLAAASAESFTTRIEPRPYYGSVVTVEQGVRVWRPIPPPRHMIINPTGSPVSLNLTDVRETSTHNGVPIAVQGAAPIVEGPGRYSGPYYYPRGFGHHHHRHRNNGLAHPGLRRR